MFAPLAPKLIANGWSSLIPLRGKVPLIHGWSQFNLKPPSEGLIEQWSQRYANAGIGLVFGPDKVVSVDLDWLEATTARRAYELTIEICGQSDFFRIGQPPKRMVFYRIAPGLIVPGKSFGGYELFYATGQAVLFSIHPHTGLPYVWPKRSPENGRPNDLPLLTQVALDALQKALVPFCHQGLRREDNTGYLSKESERGSSTLVSDHNNGRVAAWLKICRDSSDQNPLDLCRGGVSAARPGDRYPTAFGAVVALVMLGRTDAEICASVIVPYSSLFERHEAPRRVASMRSALKWARGRIGPDAVTIEQNTGAAHIADHWNRRWRRA